MSVSTCIDNLVLLLAGVRRFKEFAVSNLVHNEIYALPDASLLTLYVSVSTCIDNLVLLLAGVRRFKEFAVSNLVHNEIYALPDASLLTL